MTFYEQCLGGYVPQGITLPVMYGGKPVGLLLDGGHGLEQYTPGKRSPDGTLIEGRWNREMVARLLPDLRAIGFDARCLVPEDEDIKLADRVARANAIMAREPDKAWFYLSVHINAASGPGWEPRASGFCAYAGTNASEVSRNFARAMVAAAHRFGLKGNRSVPKEGYWTAGFYVIRCTKMPAILTESLFMTNPKECEFLKSEKGKETLSFVHVEALCDFFRVPYAHVDG